MRAESWAPIYYLFILLASTVKLIGARTNLLLNIPPFSPSASAFASRTGQWPAARKPLVLLFAGGSSSSTTVACFRCVGACVRASVSSGPHLVDFRTFDLQFSRWLAEFRAAYFRSEAAGLRPAVAATSQV